MKTPIITIRKKGKRIDKRKRASRTDPGSDEAPPARFPKDLKNEFELPNPVLLRLVSTTPEPVYSCDAYDRDGHACCIRYVRHSIIGKGAFGEVVEIIIQSVEPFLRCALKSQMIEGALKRRELSVLRSVSHPNVVKLYYFYTIDSHIFKDNKEHHGIELHLIMEYVVANVGKMIGGFVLKKDRPSDLLAKVIMFQLFRGLAYLHNLNIAHRDVKPCNILIDQSMNVKLCDFGSVVRFTSEKEEHVPYVCTRNYRAPELILGNCHYNCKIDMWSAGLVLCELHLLKCLFCGKDSVDQLQQIFRFLGTPSKEEMNDIMPSLKANIPVVKRQGSWVKKFKGIATPAAIELMSKLVTYSPKLRLDAATALTDMYFDILRKPSTRERLKLPVNLFNFMDQEWTYLPRERILGIRPSNTDSSNKCSSLTRRSASERWRIAWLFK